MNLIELATKRLEELNRAGIAVPLASVNMPHGEQRTEAGTSLRAVVPDVVRSAQAPRLKQAAPIEEPSAPEPVKHDAEPRIDIVLDLERLEGAGYLVASDTRSPLAEEFRQIKRPLLKNARSQDAFATRRSLIAVTSALPGEGKTFSAINLAMSIATEIDLSVLFIDADVVRRDAMDRLGVTAEVGLIDLLTDDSLSLEDVVLQTNVPKLSVLPAGRRHHLSTELLASSAMDDLLQKLAEDFPRQVVVFDAPPLLLTSEAKVLAARVGQVVMVVEASHTQRNAVARAFEAVEQCQIVMSVLNKATSQPKDGGYGYGYGYY